MQAHPFLQRDSIVRTIWGDPDLVLLIFAGGAAEFALNRAVDWLFFTNRLPNDPIARLFSTVRYAQRIVFASEMHAANTLHAISAAHADVERRRGQRIPAWAHRAVLYMLIDYSERAHRLVYGPLTPAQQSDLYTGFVKVGRGLQIPELPETYERWRRERERALERDLVYSEHTHLLFERYREQLGYWRYQVLLEVQAVLAPMRVRAWLGLTPRRLLIGGCVQIQTLIRRLGLQQLAYCVLIPPRYWDQVERLTPSLDRHVDL